MEVYVGCLCLLRASHTDAIDMTAMCGGPSEQGTCHSDHVWNHTWQRRNVHLHMDLTATHSDARCGKRGVLPCFPFLAAHRRGEKGDASLFSGVCALPTTGQTYRGSGAADPSHDLYCRGPGELVQGRGTFGTADMIPVLRFCVSFVCPPPHTFLLLWPRWQCHE